MSKPEPESKALETPLPTRGIAHEADDSPSMSKYADSAKREELIQKLLTDYNERKRTPRSYLDLPEEVGRVGMGKGYGTREGFSTFEAASPYTDTILFGQPSPQSPMPHEEESRCRPV
ncbi:hypothetical protein EON63_03675, partial [archaeon]